MSFWDWDNFEKRIDQIQIHFERDEVIPPFITSVKFKRSKNFKITFTIKSAPCDIDPAAGFIPGMLSFNEKTLKIKSVLGNGKLEEVSHITSQTIRLNNEPEYSLNTYEARLLEFNYSEKSTTSIIEYVANLPTHYLWPNITKDTFTERSRREFGSQEGSMFTVETERTQCNRSSIRLVIDGHELFISLSSETQGNIENSGFIYYNSMVRLDVRDKIRSCLSYAFGSPIVYFGCSEYLPSGKLGSYSAVSPHTVNGRAWDIAATPPAPISCEQRILESAMIERVANGLYGKFHLYRLAELPWRIWYAEISPYFMRPAYYGAFIEGLQQSYLKHNHEKINSKIVSKNDYKQIKAIAIKIIERSDLECQHKKIFINKVANGNSLSQKFLSERFFEHVGMSLGTLETQAWANRNDAAHGNEIDDSRTIGFIRNSKILKQILNRLVLKITNGSDFYIDYYSLGHPIRPVTEHIPDDSSV